MLLDGAICVLFNRGLNLDERFRKLLAEWNRTQPAPSTPEEASKLVKRALHGSRIADVQVSPVLYFESVFMVALVYCSLVYFILVKRSVSCSTIF